MAFPYVLRRRTDEAAGLPVEWVNNRANFRLGLGRGGFERRFIAFHVGRLAASDFPLIALCIPGLATTTQASHLGYSGEASSMSHAPSHHKVMLPWV